MTVHHWDVVEGRWLADEALYCTECGRGISYIIDADTTPACGRPVPSPQRVEAFRARVAAWHALVRREGLPGDATTHPMGAVQDVPAPLVPPQPAGTS